MKLGMIVRCDWTGLGNQTWDMWRHLQPSATLVIIPTSGAGANLPQHVDRYPNAATIKWDPRSRALGPILEDTFRDCDMVWSAETFYDPTAIKRLAALGVRSVLHANPELWDGEETPDELWLPTSWRVAEMTAACPVPVVVVPMPCPTDRTSPSTPDREPKRIVHPTSIAMGDRNGGATVDRALSLWRQPGRNILVDPVGPPTKWMPDARTVTDWWERDRGAWVSVIPRRYGGLCLPALEAFAAGVPVVMPAVSPQADDWPIVPVTARITTRRAMKGGRIPMYAVNPGELRSVTQMLFDDKRREDAAARVRLWASENGPDRLIPVWRNHLERVSM